MSEDKVVTKSWIEKRIHEKAVKRYENEINQAFNQLKDSVVGELSLRKPLKDYLYNVALKYLDESDYPKKSEAFSTIFKRKEETFSSIFKDYDEFKKQKIEDYEQEETDTILKAIKGKGIISVVWRLWLDQWGIKK